MSDTAEQGFRLAEPVLVCRWRLAGRHVPLLNRHMRALSQRRVQGEPLTMNMLGWVKQHIEWALAEDPSAIGDGVLMLVVDERGQAAMSTGVYEPLADASLAALAARAQTAQVEATQLAVAPEALCIASGGEVVIGVPENATAAGAVSLVEQLAQTRGARVTRDPALPFRALTGMMGGAAFLVSDEHGVVAAEDATGEARDAEVVAFLVESFEKLRDTIR